MEDKETTRGPVNAMPSTAHGILMTPIINRQQAKQQKLNRYFTGLPCKYEHISERYTFTGNKCMWIACRKQFTNTKSKGQSKEK